MSIDSAEFMTCLMQVTHTDYFTHYLQREAFARVEPLILALYDLQDSELQKTICEVVRPFVVFRDGRWQYDRQIFDAQPWESLAPIKSFMVTALTKDWDKQNKTRAHLVWSADFVSTKVYHWLWYCNWLNRFPQFTPEWLSNALQQ